MKFLDAIELSTVPNKTILKFNEQLIEKMYAVRCGGVPLSFHLLDLRKTDTWCVHSAMLLEWVVPNSIVVSANIITIEDGRETLHTWVEADGFVYDTTYGLVYNKELYYDLYKPTKVEITTAESIENFKDLYLATIFDILNGTNEYSLYGKELRDHIQRFKKEQKLDEYHCDQRLYQAFLAGIQDCYAEITGFKTADINASPGFLEIQSNLDVFSIQDKVYGAEEVVAAIDSIVAAERVIFFTNLESVFELNGREIPMEFPTCLWVPGDKMVKCVERMTFKQAVMVTDTLSFKVGDILDETGIRQILAAKNISYIDMPSQQTKRAPKVHTGIPEIWFGGYVEAFDELVKVTNENIATIYPNVTGRLRLIYYPSVTAALGHPVDERNFSGLIELGAQVLLPVVLTTREKSIYEAGGAIGYTPLIEHPQHIAGSFNVAGIAIKTGEGLPAFIENCPILIREVKLI